MLTIDALPRDVIFAIFDKLVDAPDGLRELALLLCASKSARDAEKDHVYKCIRLRQIDTEAEQTLPPASWFAKRAAQIERLDLPDFSLTSHCAAVQARTLALMKMPFEQIRFGHEDVHTGQIGVWLRNTFTFASLRFLCRSEQRDGAWEGSADAKHLLPPWNAPDDTTWSRILPVCKVLHFEFWMHFPAWSTGSRAEQNAKVLKALSWRKNLKRLGFKVHVEVNFATSQDLVEFSVGPDDGEYGEDDDAALDWGEGDIPQFNAYAVLDGEDF